MGAALGLLSALAYGSADFAAGLASRRFDAGPVALATQALGLLTAVLAVLLFAGSGPSARTLEWGAASGLGSAVGTLALYRGLAAAQMSVVATLSALLTAVIPVLVGIALGNRVGLLTAVGIVIAIPAIGLVSWQPGDGEKRTDGAGLLYGVMAGVGFAVLFIALDQAGTRAGAWPLIPGQAVSLVLVAPFAYRVLANEGRPTPSATALVVGAGVLSGVANLLFLTATGHGQLAVVAVLTALYPTVTVLLARVLLAERWTAQQVVGLITAAAAIVLVTVG